MNQGIILVKSPQIIQVMSQFPIFPLFQNFSFTLTQDSESEFTLPSYPLLTGLIVVTIDGVMQDYFNGDFTVNGNVLTVNSSLFAGQKVSGFYQAMGSNINPAVLNYRSFFFLAGAGQSKFTLSFVPKAVIYVAINGVLQSIQDGDFSVKGPKITTSEPLDANDKLFGVAIQ